MAYFSSHPLATGCPPTWASAWGQDQYGPWVALCVGEVEQRLRWIPPGRFLMGSPDSDREASGQEKPRHEVQLTRGFWLFDTPCTQGLWQEVMGANPSRFQEEDSAERPVESVSWEDCQMFIAKLNELLPGLALRLPTEAEWEYACRAGTDTPRYAQNLGAIAWYDKNSKGETHPVKQRQPNTWGLYDMLGNVFEWCHDGQRDYTADAVVDPLGPTTAGANRVIRGGDWVWFAQRVRAAYHDAYLPGSRIDHLGFRCASS
jgi:formylglycine-generating enzyme